MPTRATVPRPLTARQARFVELYLVSLNATQAAIGAGYSAKTAAEGGWELLRTPKVAAAIASGQQALSVRSAIDADQLIRELAIVGFSDVRNYQVDANGELSLRPGIHDAAWRAVSSVKHKVRSRTDDKGVTETTREIEFKLWDKNAAIEKLAKRIRFYPPDKVELTGEDGGPLLVAGMALEDLSDEQLAALAVQLAKVAP